MKKYVFELEIKEGSDEFWEDIKGTGCDEVKEIVVNALSNYGFYNGDNCTLKLKQFIDE